MADTLERLRTALAGRYTIEREIGAGGMATVYLAEDVKHRRRVALKVLRPELAASVGAERFLREIELVAQLHHPHIVPLHDSGEADGLLFYVMPFVEGQSLRERLTREGELPIPDALRVLRDVVDALSAAHAQHVVHRDVKAENVLLHGRHALVTDFGIAKAVSDSAPPDQLTGHGIALGTPAYMAPEQISADQRADHRVDVYAVGVLAYELLTGRTPFEGSTPQQIFAGHLIDEPDPPSMHRPAVTPELERTVLRCLAKNPADRWQSADELLHEIERLSAPPATVPGTVSPSAEAGGYRSPRRIAAVAAIAIVLGSAVVWAFVASRRDTTSQPASLVQLTANPPERSLYSAAISPDGAYLAFTDPRGLHLQHLATSETQRLDVGLPIVPRTVLWYPDGARLLFLATDTTQDVSLWSITIIGGRARRLMDDVIQASISPDGRHIAAARGHSTREGAASDVWLMSADGTNVRPLVRPGPRESFWHLEWTADSRAVALGVWSDTTKTIELAPVDGGRRRLLISDPTLHQSWTGILPFAWCRDGRLVYGRRDGPSHQATSNVWIVDTDIAKGVVRGAPRRLTQWTGANVRELSVTADCSKVVVLQMRNQPDVFVGELDAGGRSLRSERKLTLDEREDFPTSWSPDSRRLLLTSSRSGDIDVYAKDVAGEADELDALYRGPGDQYNGVYTPAGDAVLFLEQGRVSIGPTTGGSTRVLVAGPFSYVRCPRRPGRPCVAGRPSGDRYVFFSLDPVRGETREIAQAAHRIPFTSWDLSPDGSKVAVVHNDDDTITIVQLESGQERVVRVDGWRYFEFVSWSADGNGFFATGSTAIGTGYPALLRVDADGRVHVLRQHPNEWHVRLHASPDGQSLAFAKVSFHGNAWMIEGFR